MRTGSDLIHVITDDHGSPLACGDSKDEAIARAVAQERLSEKQVRETLPHFVYPAINVAAIKPIASCKAATGQGRDAFCRCDNGHHWVVKNITTRNALGQWCPICVQLYSLGKTIEQLLLLSATLDEHPEGYEGPCNCQNICQKGL